MEREVVQDPILQRIIEKIEEEARRYTNSNKVKVNGKQMGVFTYLRNKEEKTKHIYLITIPIKELKYNKYVYAEDGDKIAKLDASGNIVTDNNIDLNEKNLKRQIELAEEQERQQLNNNNGGTASAGEGRDLASKEHEEKKPEEDKQNDKTKNNNMSQVQEDKNILPNLKGDISLEYSPKIRLDTLINGYYLWEILDIETKLKDRAPDGVSERAFRTGYLSIVNSKELEQKDGKKRESEDTFVIATYSGDIIELDEQFLELEPQRSMQRRKEIEQSRHREADGSETKSPSSEYITSKTTSYRIPKVNERFAVGEEWFLSVDINQDYRRIGARPIAGNTKEISFGQQSRNNSINERELGYKRLETKLEAINEPPQNEKELKQKEDLAKKDANEAANTLENHMPDLVEECKKECPNWGEYYNSNELEEMVKGLHEELRDDEAVIEMVKKNVEERSKEPSIYDRKRR